MKKFAERFTGKIRVKLFAVIILVLMVMFAVILSTSSPLYFRAFTKNTYSNLRSIASTIDTYNPVSSGYYFDLYYISTNRGVEFELVDADGILTYTSTGNGSALSSSHFPSSSMVTPRYFEMKDSVNYKDTFHYQGFEIKRQTSTNVEYFVYHTDLLSGDTVYIYYPVADVENVVNVSEEIFMVFSIVIILIMAIVFLIIVSKFTKPVEEINDVTKDMAALDFERKCEDYGKDEIGELGRSINTLSTALNSALMDLKEKNVELEKDNELRRVLDNARKAFISNVSHELKTPIAIISGYAEGLYEGISTDPEMIKEYCGIINDESKKMNNLVLELLELSKLESHSVPFNPDYFDIGDSIASLLEHLSMKINEAGIKVTNNVPESLICYAQAEKIEIVLKNYITNAIAHCEGTKEILIDSQKKNNTLEISVFNTGSCISKEDISEIWVSFYRADKSHDRSSNRFGLGLSIVKSIMENHNCNYGVSNEENGVRFTFEVAEDSTYYEEINN